MFHSARGHRTVNAVAKSFGADRGLILSLCEHHGIPLVMFEGVRFLRDDDLAAVCRHFAAWQLRPRLKIHHRRRLRPRRTYAPWREGRASGNPTADLARLNDRIARLFPHDDIS